MSIESERRRLYQKRSGEDQIFKGLLEENGRLEKENLRLTEIINKLVPGGNQPHKVRLILTSNIQNSIFQIMALSIAANQETVGALGLLDIVTNAPVTGTFAGTTASSDTPAAFTAAVDENGNVDVVAVAAGTGNVIVNTNATFTDSTGAQQTQSLSVSIPVTITAVVTADGVALTVAFGIPVTQPASL